MTKGKHHKAIKYTPVTGGTQLVYRGGWANGITAVESVYVGTKIFVLADLCGGFGQLVFGSTRPKPQDKAQVSCLGNLQLELQKVVDAEVSSGAYSSVVAEAAAEQDPMGDAESFRPEAGQAVAQ